MSEARRLTTKRLALAGATAGLLACVLLFGALYAYAGWYGINALLRRGGGTWTVVPSDSQSLSASMRLALQDAVPVAQAGPFEWRELTRGFEVAKMPVVAGGAEVDRVLLTRVDPTLFRFEVRNEATGNKGLDE